MPFGELLALERGDDFFYLHGDGLSSTQLVTDETGAQVGRFIYGAWGEELYASESVPGILENRFVGGLGCRKDAATGLIYMWHRWYDPALQRFISRDPIGLSYLEVEIKGFQATANADLSSGNLARGEVADLKKSPQIYSDNHYSYASRNPIKFIDPLGLASIIWTPPPNRLPPWPLNKLLGPAFREHACYALFLSVWGLCTASERQGLICGDEFTNCAAQAQLVWDRCRDDGNWPTKSIDITQPVNAPRLDY